VVAAPPLRDTGWASAAVSYAYCRPHASHFCPCCKPHLYRGEGDAEKIRGWAEIAPIVPIEQQAQAPSILDMVEIPMQEWVVLLSEAKVKDARSAQAHWTRVWAKDFNLRGLMGEWLYSKLTGIPRKRGFGDGGEDFPGVDVKTSSYLVTPWLRHPATEPLRTRYYALVAADTEQRLCRYVGYATADELLAVMPTALPHGQAKILYEKDLHKQLPPHGGKD
jgi:hypothetical protein